MKHFLLLFFLGLVTVGTAQPRVYHVSGEAYRQAQPRPLPLHFGEAVLPGQTLDLKPGSQVVFITPQGKTLAYSQAGRLDYNDLQKAFGAVPPSPTAQYVAYVCRKMTERTVAVEQQGNVPVGGVSRGDLPLLWAPADSVVFEQPEAAFEWVAGEAPFRFTITDATGASVLQLTTPASVLSLNMLLSGLKRNAVYYWTVTPAAGGAGNAPRRVFVWLDETLKNQLRAQVPALAGQRPGATELQWQAQFRARWAYEQVGR